MAKNFVEELKWRGMLAQMMPGTEEYLNTHMVSAYLGTDPTADSPRGRCYRYDWRPFWQEPGA